jgi:hypothetical protein
MAVSSDSKQPRPGNDGTQVHAKNARRIERGKHACGRRRLGGMFRE